MSSPNRNLPVADQTILRFLVKQSHGEVAGGIGVTELFTLMSRNGQGKGGFGTSPLLRVWWWAFVIMTLQGRPKGGAACIRYTLNVAILRVNGCDGALLILKWEWFK